MPWQATLRYDSNVCLTNSFDLPCKTRHAMYVIYSLCS
jgi:hypothetical protein